MTQGTLTEEIAIEAFRTFFREKPFVVFGSGMSCALDLRFGMSALKDALIVELANQTLTEPQKAEWDAVLEALNHGADLENALDSARDASLLQTLTQITGSFIASVDKEYAYQIAQGVIEWPALRLLKRLVDTTPEGDRILHVLTPNYDMLFEYAFEFADVLYTNGNFGGVERKKDWGAVGRALLESTSVRQRGRMQHTYKSRKHARIYKVHGSLNYFFHHDIVVENNAWMWDPPSFAQRVMITPGLSKYQALQRYRQELLQSADAAIENSTHFLFLGYGFNDSHLEEYIRRKLVNQGSHGLIVTRDSNPRIESLLEDSDNLWLVCKSDEGAQDGSRVFNKNYSDWLVVSDKKLWDVSEFTTQILGG
jgi:hypothetical protein